MKASHRRTLRKSHSIFPAHAVIFCFTLGLISLGFSYVLYKQAVLHQEYIRQQQAKIEETYKNLSLEAKSFVVYDITSKEIIAGKNENQVLPLASLTKVATALTSFSLDAVDKHVEIMPKSIDEGYDLGLVKDQIWSVKELIRYMLTFSSNDAAQVLADNLLGRDAFIKAMNAYSEKFSSTLHFTSPSGLDDGEILGGEGTALDVAKLMAYFYSNYPAILESTTHDRLRVKTLNSVLTGIPNTDTSVDSFINLYGSKTGFTDLAGGNLAIVFDAAFGRPVAIVVLGSSRDGRFKDMKKLHDLTRQNYKESYKVYPF